MAVLDILTYPDPFLRLKAKEVVRFGKEFQDLVNSMFETMRDAPGVGLAAPQIGKSLRLVVIEYTKSEEEDAKPKKYVLVNPKIVEESEERVTDLEGCLSLPGLAGEVERSTAITVKAQNRYGKPVKYQVDGWLARIFQHEMDHLDGVLYIDRATNVFQPAPEQAKQIRD